MYSYKLFVDGIEDWGLKEASTELGIRNGVSNDRTMIWNRQLDGALNRVPSDFYERVWRILERTPAGIKVAGYHLPQVSWFFHGLVFSLEFLMVWCVCSSLIRCFWFQFGLSLKSWSSRICCDLLPLWSFLLYYFTIFNTIVLFDIVLLWGYLIMITLR